jgi:putative phage-type endonuclease
MSEQTKPFDRMLGIGGSEIASVLGVNKFKSRKQLFLEKTGRGKEFKGNIYTEQGKKEEDRIADLYMERCKKELFTIYECKKVDTVFSKQIPFLYASLDRLIYFNAHQITWDNQHHFSNTVDVQKYILEIKTSQISNYKGWHNPDIVNAYWFNGGAGYYWQLLHYMIVYNLNMAVLYCQFFDKTEPTDKFFRLTVNGGWAGKLIIVVEKENGKFIKYESSRDDYTFLIKEAEKFWDEVVKWRKENEQN